MYSNDKAAIITFSYGNSSYTKVLSGLTSSKATLKDSLQNFTDVGGTCFSYALNRAVALLQSSGELERDDVINRIIFLSDGEPDNDTQANINAAVANAASHGIQIFAFGLGTASGDAVLENMATSTGGDFYKVIEASELPRIVEQAVTTQTDLSQDFESLMDVNSDNDSLPDVVEKFGLMFNGTPIETNIYKEDTDDDGLWDDEEVIFDRTAFIAGLEKGVCTEGITFFANPTEPHSDTDGLRDDEDAKPLTDYDQRFMLIDDCNYIPSIDFVERHVDFGEECVYSIFPTPVDVANFTLFSALCNAGISTPGLAIWLQLTGSEFVGEYEHIVSVKFSQFLAWYLWANGDTLYLSNDEIYSTIWSSQQNIEHYSYNVNQLRAVAESIVTEKNDLSNPVILSTKSSSLFKACCYKGNYCDGANHNVRYDDTTALDWGYAWGEALCAMTAEASMVNGEYFMKIKYYIIDNYEYAYHWEEQEGNLSFFDKAGHRLHEAGIGHEYKVIGVWEDAVKWKTGEVLYPENYVDIILDEDKYNAGPYR